MYKARNSAIMKCQLRGALDFFDTCCKMSQISSSVIHRFTYLVATAALAALDFFDFDLLRGRLRDLDE